MEHFILKEWHVALVFVTMLTSILKTDIMSGLNSLVLMVEQRGLKGKTVQLLGADGEWTEIRINYYKSEIPFIRNGGVYISHLNSDNGYVQEKLSFQSWKAQRIRILEND